jgi:hypothetical protein
MTMTEEPTVPTSAGGNPIGFGRMLRKEDVRFVRGKGQCYPACCTVRFCAAPTPTRGSSR